MISCDVMILEYCDQEPTIFFVGAQSSKHILSANSIQVTDTIEHHRTHIIDISQILAYFGYIEILLCHGISNRFTLQIPHKKHNRNSLTCDALMFFRWALSNASICLDLVVNFTSAPDGLHCLCGEHVGRKKYGSDINAYLGDMRRSRLDLQFGKFYGLWQFVVGITNQHGLYYVCGFYRATSTVLKFLADKHIGMKWGHDMGIPEIQLVNHSVNIGLSKTGRCMAIPQFIVILTRKMRFKT